MKFLKWSLIFCLAHLVAVAVIYGDEPKAFAPSDQQVLLHAEAQRHRVAHGRDVQSLDADLCALSQRWAEHMASTGSRSHGGGENIIAWGQPTASSAMTTWIHSSGHNAWLLSNTTRAGWGAAYGNGRWNWVGAFRSSESATTTTDGGSYDSGRRWFRFFRR